jgi:hypothetical protein
MAQLTPWIHTYTTRDLLDDSFDLFKAAALPLTLVGVLPLCLVALYNVVMRLFVVREQLLSEFTREALGESLGNPLFWLYGLGLLGCTLVAVILTQLAQCRVALLQAFGEPITLRAAFSRLLKPFFSALLVVPLVGIAAAVGCSVAGFVVAAVFTAITSALIQADYLVVAVVLGVVFTIAQVALQTVLWLLVITWFLAFPGELIVKQANPFDALGASTRAAGRRMKELMGVTLVYLTLPFALVPLSAMLVGGVFLVSRTIDPTSSVLLIVTLVNGLIGVVVTGVFACYSTLVYIDAACRLDNLDLRLMARQVGLGDEIDQALAPTYRLPQAGAYPNYAVQPVLAAAAPDYTRIPDLDMPQPPITPFLNPAYHAPVADDPEASPLRPAPDLTIDYTQLPPPAPAGEEAARAE